MSARLNRADVLRRRCARALAFVVVSAGLYFARVTATVAHARPPA